MVYDCIGCVYSHEVTTGKMVTSTHNNGFYCTNEEAELKYRGHINNKERFYPIIHTCDFKCSGIVKAPKLNEDDLERLYKG